MIEAMQPVLPKGSAVIVGEPSMMQAVTGHKGGFGFDTHVQGFEVHSSIMHTGVNAIMASAPLIDWANERNAENMAAKPSDMAAIFVPPLDDLSCWHDRRRHGPQHHRQGLPLHDGFPGGPR